MRRPILALLGSVALAAAEASAAAHGGQAGALYQFGLGTQAFGFGGATLSLARDPATILTNPAGAACIGRGVFVASHTLMALGRSVNVVGFGMQSDPRAGFSVAWVNGGVGDVKGYDQNGNATGTLKNGENMFVMSFGTRFGAIMPGVSAKWLRTQLDDRSSTAWAADLGVLVRLSRNLHVGIAMRNLEGHNTWTKTRNDGSTTRLKEGLPTTLAAGASYCLRPMRLTVATDYEYIDREGQYLHFGATWTILPALQLRAGYRWLGLRGASAHEGTPTAGATLRTGIGGRRINFDYAILSDPLGLVHSLGIRFEL